MNTTFWNFILLLVLVNAQLKGNVKKNVLLPIQAWDHGKSVQWYLTLDANWRWVHYKDNVDNCFANGWVQKYCPDAKKCAENCMLEGIEQAEYLSTYGISVSSSALTLRYVTKHTHGENVGSRLYLIGEDQQTYKGFDFTGKQFSFTVDVSQVPCGMNGAVYSIEMPLDGGLNQWNKAGAPYGTGYGDAQCAKDITWIGGLANLNQSGACSVEMDFWEANRMATAFTPHTCSTKGTQMCVTPLQCGDGNQRYKGWCDKDGADYNPYRLGNQSFYGMGSSFAVDTTKPFEVITQFIAPNGKLSIMRRFYRQHGKVIYGGEMSDTLIAQRKQKFSETNHFNQLGGMKGMQESFQRQHVMAFSLWDDVSVSMLWLDSTYPVGSKEPGALRGPCSGKENNAFDLRKKSPNSQVVYSDFKFGPIESFGHAAQPSQSPRPQPKPSVQPLPPSPSSSLPSKSFSCKCTFE